jgi:hypothetical protein
MDSKFYHQLYEALHSHADVEKLSQKYNIGCGTLSSILNQKIVEDVKKSHHKFVRKEQKIVAEWKAGKTFSELGKIYHHPATLISSLILQNLGYSKKEIRSFYKNPISIENFRIRNELKDSLDSDYYFSPRAHQLQEEKGRIGENIVSSWLKNKCCDFICENDMRAEGHVGKTPDFLLKKSIKIRDSEICWIESKAMFGELKEHRYYEKKQFSAYHDCYGDGLVVYWFGFETDILKEKEDGYQIADFEFFKKDVPEHVNKILNYVIHW